MACDRRLARVSRGWGGNLSDTKAIPQSPTHVLLWPVSNAYTSYFSRFGHVFTGLPSRRRWYYSGIRVVLPWALWSSGQPGGRTKAAESHLHGSAARDLSLRGT